MFIQEIIKNNPGYNIYHRLVEAVRTTKGPRQRIVLNLSTLDIPRDDWKPLTARIEQILYGQQPLIPTQSHIESLAPHYAALLWRKEIQSIPSTAEQEQDWQTVDLSTLSQSKYHTIGEESVSYDAFQHLGLSEILSELGFRQEEIDGTALLTIERLLHPWSERDTALWSRETSTLEELLGADFQHPSNNTLYGLYDKVLKHREVIEWRLWERKTFHLGRKGLLYDLTNTYLTERGYESTKAHHGRSKEKRNDCPLLTLALVLDEEEFAKSSRVLEGNVSEPETLQEFLEAFKKERGTQLSLLSKLPTVVVYAGVCTQENLDLILEQVFHYISVSRNKPQEIPQEDLTMIKQDKDCTLKAKRMDHEGEVFLYCESTARARKEESMKAKFHQKHYEEGLSSIAKSLSKKRVMQRYEKVMERLGRLRERYPTISQYYQVEVEQGSGRTTGMTWSIKREEEMRLRFSGTYYLQGFNSKGIVNRWGAIKSRLATQVWITASITNGKGARIHLQHTIDPRSLSIMRSTSLWGYCQAVETQTTGDLKDVELIDYCIMTFTGSIRCLCCDCW